MTLLVTPDGGLTTCGFLPTIVLVGHEASLDDGFARTHGSEVDAVWHSTWHST